MHKHEHQMGVAAPSMAVAVAADYTLLGGCADFYQEIAAIKCAFDEDRLAAHLSPDSAPDAAAAPATDSELAKRVSARLLTFLRQQERDFRRNATVQEIRAHRVALYLMAALADEIFILDAKWRWGDAWLDGLLEQKLFRTNNAGSRLFIMARQLISAQSRNPLYIDLAAVFLLTLELGFRGRYRGRQGEAALAELRAQLYQLTKQKSRSGGSFDVRAVLGPQPAFTQAYDYQLQGDKDQRLAPVSPWCSVGLYALLAYLMLSTIAWLMLLYPFERYIAG
jgi:type VI secretion system protein ImpK